MSQACLVCSVGEAWLLEISFNATSKNGWVTATGIVVEKEPGDLLNPFDTELLCQGDGRYHRWRVAFSDHRPELSSDAGNVEV